ncbi:uncharacterized protein EAF02_002574 [Botrytis sinoallii]|uniref:uncharacterized protein n=1 Tax=Botrytis sinoallii TaxID=1463999 RepID=UPI0018FF86A6|nr:uncharacterized protein EAF02_002574 [Botrytis sinoallii]KAF7888033.1 hypothetical protein EAF02_002574 [Botrytis sinoallii]
MLEHLCELLRNISRYFDNVHLVVDALDECGDGRLDIVRLLTELNATKDSNIKIILASRPEPDIESHLVDFTKLSIAAHRNDLELYVHSKIECRLRETQKTPWNQELREEIAQRLVDEAQVRWVTCQLDHLYDLDTLRGVRRALHSLPPTLFGTYERILDRINLSSDEIKELVRRVLIWTVCAVEPLSLAQLLEAVSIDLSDKHLDREGIPNEQSILKRCSSLVRKTEGPWGIRIELAHFSVKEFLLLEVQDDRYSMYRMSQDFRNAYMAKVCLTYLLFEDFQDVTPHTTPTEKSATDKKYAFYHYASLHFVSHACSDADDHNILELLKLLFNPIKTNSFVFWVQELLIHYYGWNSRQKIICNTSTLHFAILLSIPRVVEWLISDTDTYSYLTKNGDVGTLSATIIDPLSFTTSEWGNSPCTNLLELAIKAHFGWDILLQHGALITDSCIKALEEDFEHSYDFITSFVQSTNPRNVPADINSRFMHFAGKLKDVDKPLVDSFFDSSVDIDSTEAIAALHAAITFGQTYNVLQVLKKWNPSINSCSNIDGLSPLHRASKGGHLEIVKILLNYGASLDLPTSIDGIDTTENLFGLKCATSFHLAVANGHINVARFLEEYGADINKPDMKSGITPLHSATAQRIEMMEYLIQSSLYHGSFSTKTPTGWTVLMAAAKLGSIDAFEFVLCNSDPSIVILQDETGFNCFHEAIRSSIAPRRKVAVLRRSCVNPFISTKEGLTPLHIAAERGFNIFRETLEFILNSLSRLSVGLSRKSGRHNKLCLGVWIVYSTYFDTQGINLEVGDIEGRSTLLVLCNALQKAQRYNYRKHLFAGAIELLLHYGAITTRQDVAGNTALHYLCRSGSFGKYEYRCMSALLAARHSTFTDTSEILKSNSPNWRSGDNRYDQNDSKDRSDYVPKHYDEDYGNYDIENDDNGGYDDEIDDDGNDDDGSDDYDNDHYFLTELYSTTQIFAQGATI